MVTSTEVLNSRRMVFMGEIFNAEDAEDAETEEDFGSEVFSALFAASAFNLSVSDEVQGVDEDVDELDPDKRNHDAAEAVEEEVAAQDGGGADRTVSHSAQGERDKRDDDERVENDRAEDGAQRRSEVHDVERGDGGKH